MFIVACSKLSLALYITHSNSYAFIWYTNFQNGFGICRFPRLKTLTWLFDWVIIAKNIGLLVFFFPFWGQKEITDAIKRHSRVLEKDAHFVKYVGTRQAINHKPRFQSCQARLDGVYGGWFELGAVWRAQTLAESSFFFSTFSSRSVEEIWKKFRCSGAILSFVGGRAIDRDIFFLNF